MQTICSPTTQTDTIERNIQLLASARSALVGNIVIGFIIIAFVMSLLIMLAAG